MRLVEEGEDAVTPLEAGDSSTGSNDGAGPVGCRDDRNGEWEGVPALLGTIQFCSHGDGRVDGWRFYLYNREVSVVERSVVEVDENVVVAELGNFGLFIEFEAVEAIFASEGPLLGG